MGEDLKGNMSQADGARKYDVHPSSACHWDKVLQENGMKWLNRKKAPGIPSKLSNGQQEILREILLKGATAYGYKTDLWTLRRAVDVIKKEFDITYHFRSLSDLPHQLGFSCQKPTRQATVSPSLLIK